MPILTAAGALVVACAFARQALAHAGGGHPHPDLVWSWEPWVLCSLGIASLWYALGIWRICRRGSLGRVIGPGAIAAFSGGMLMLFLALVSPIDTISGDLFSMHMVQHLILLMLAPPLLVMGRPPIVCLWAFRDRPRRQIGRNWTALNLGRAVGLLLNPVLGWLLFSGSFVFWHLPGPYQWAVRSEFVHAVEHLSFFLTALIFWTAVIEPSGRRRNGYGATLLLIATTAAFSALPGALIFLAPHPLYPVHADGVAAWGLTLLQDQQLAGLIMWIPGGLIYLIALLWVMARWLNEAELPRRGRVLPPAALGLAALLLTIGVAQAQSLSEARGDPDQGAVLIRQFGCGTCHTIPGIAGADGLVGPPLIMMSRRIYIAGMLRNTPANMMFWLEHPQSVVPGNAMPNMGIMPQQARDITAYLYTLR